MPKGKGLGTHRHSVRSGAEGQQGGPQRFRDPPGLHAGPRPGIHGTQNECPLTSCASLAKCVTGHLRKVFLWGFHYQVVGGKVIWSGVGPSEPSPIFWRRFDSIPPKYILSGIQIEMRGGGGRVVRGVSAVRVGGAGRFGVRCRGLRHPPPSHYFPPVLPCPHVAGQDSRDGHPHARQESVFTVRYASNYKAPGFKCRSKIQRQHSIFCVCVERGVFLC